MQENVKFKTKFLSQSAILSLSNICMSFMAQ